MVNAINKYDWTDWKHEIIDSCGTRDKANKLEEYYIGFYKSNNSKYGYIAYEGIPPQFPEHYYLYPVPTSEILLNPKIKQNPGW